MKGCKALLRLSKKSAVISMHEGVAAPSFLIVSTGFAGRAGDFGASAQKNHFRSLAMQDEVLHPARRVSKAQFFDTQ